MLGEQIVERFRIVQNDAHDRDSHAFDGDDRAVATRSGFTRSTCSVTCGF